MTVQLRTALFLALSLLALFAPSAATAGDGVWNSFHLQDINGPVFVMAHGPQGEVYVGGSFTEAGGIRADNIARWHKGVWSGLGSGVSGGTMPSVHALTVADNGTVYAGGLFTTAGGKTANNIARWDGSQWQNLGNGSDNKVTNIVIDSNDNVYAAGWFTTMSGVGANCIARWRGGSWEALGSGLQGGLQRVHAVVYSNGSLIVGGSFRDAGGVEVDNVARWDGSQWHALGEGIPEYTAVVYALMVDSTTVYAAGSFALPGSFVSANVRRWDGAVWNNEAYFNGPVFALATDTAGLIAGGMFTWAGRTKTSLTPARRLAVVGSTSAHALGTGVDGPVYTLAVSDDGLLIGGSFSLAGTTVAHNISRWNGKIFAPVGGIPSTSVNGAVHALAFAPDGSLYVGGEFTVAGTTAANSIARWDGVRWHALGEGIDGVVHAIAVDSRGRVYAGGSFTKAGTTTANAIALWNGDEWESLNDEDSYTRVYALAVSEADMVYAGGLFSRIGTTAANCVARWDGAAWTPMNSGVDGAVYAIALRKGRLYIGGEFLATAGPVLNGIGEWNGSTWLPVGNGVGGTVYALALDNYGRLYAGGDFTQTATGAKRVAMWDGVRWRPLDEGVNHDIGAFAVDSTGRLYVAGLFSTAGKTNAAGIAMWNGTTWKTLGDGIHGAPAALAASGATLYVGGSFSAAGDAPAHNLAVWSPCDVRPEVLPEESPVLCPGTSVTLSVSGTYSSYRWSNGATTASITVDQPGIYTITVETFDGCSGTSDPVDVRSVDAVLTHSGDVEVCSGSGVQLSVEGADAYRWLPAEGLSCTDCPSPTVAPTTTTTYVVEGAVEGCMTTASITVTVLPVPEKPVVVNQETYLFCPTPAYLYQWLLDGREIPGANEASFTPGKSGLYAVRVANEHQCTTVSDAVEIFVATSVETDADSRIPLVTGADNVYTVELLLPTATGGDIVVTDLLGRVLLSRTVPQAVHHRLPVDLRTAAPGMYFLHLRFGEVRRTVRLPVE